MGFSYIRINIHTCRFFSILGYYMMLNIFPCAIYCVYFYSIYSSMYLLITDSQFSFHLSPLITISLFSMSVSLFLF